MFSKVRVRQHERGLWFEHDEFKRIVGPGEYRLWTRPFSKPRAFIDVVDTLETRFEHPLLDIIIADSDVLAQVLLVDLADDQRALLWKNGRLDDILGPGRHVFWKTPHTLRVEVFDIGQLRFEHPKLDAVLNHSGAGPYLTFVQVERTKAVLLLHNGEVIETLTPGRHVFWTGNGRLEWRGVDLREQVADVSGQEIMTSDKVTLRVNLVVTYRVTDALKAVTTSKDHEQSLYRAAQLVLRAAIGTRKLDEILGDKEVVGDEVRKALAKRAEGLGVEVQSVGLRDIILPGDMKSILNRVIVAEKEAQANLIRRREETAAARSQANTAKLLAENPILARMKELEMLQEVLAGARASFVFGSGDLSEQIRGLLKGEVLEGS